MAHFYGVVKGARGTASRVGHKSSDLTTTAASWDGAIETKIYFCNDDKINKYIVYQTPWKGQGLSRTIAEGIIGL